MKRLWKTDIKVWVLIYLDHQCIYSELENWDTMNKNLHTRKSSAQQIEEFIEELKGTPE